MKLNDTDRILIFLAGLAVTSPLWGPWLLGYRLVERIREQRRRRRSAKATNR